LASHTEYNNSVQISLYAEACSGSRSASADARLVIEFAILVDYA
jgi:hypothetical protein